MNATATPNSEIEVSEIDRNNLNLLKNLGDYSYSFKEYAQSINDLFYLYIQNCLRHNDSIDIAQEDVYQVLEIVNFLNKLQYQRNE